MKHVQRSIFPLFILAFARHAPRAMLPLLILAVAAPLRAADRQLIASLLEKAYKGQNMVLRTSNSGTMLRYSADGRLIKGGQPGPWTLDADIQCTGVELKRNDLVIKGKRLYFVYDKKLQALRPYFGPDIDVEIAIGHDSPSISALQQAIGKVFVTGSENSVLLVPDYWKDYLLHHPEESPKPVQQQMSAIPASTQKPVGESSKQALPKSPIFQVGAFTNPEKTRKVTAPVVTYKPEPPFTPEARMAHIEGWVVLSIVIDATGHVTVESIIRPLGMGLDDIAAQTLQTWRFKPSIVDGKPVPVRVLVQVGFGTH
ncbi:MAG TPA: energy transducer TonB [Terriglobia bacterium]|nr:energy transducer TonB [Terriglobia bacterium]